MKRLFQILFLFISFATSIKCFANGDTAYYRGSIKNYDTSEKVMLIRFFVKKDNTLEGYTLIDPNGAEETKCKISGEYNKHTDVLSIKEITVLRTKTTLSNSGYPFLIASLKGNNSKQIHTFEGNYSRYIDGNIVAQGRIRLVNTKVNNRMKKKFRKLYNKILSESAVQESKQ